MRGMAKADFFTSLFLMVLGIGVMVESWNMPRFTDTGTSVWSAPGVTPGIIGLALIILGAALFFRARRTVPTEGEASLAQEPTGWFHAGTAFALCFGFAGILVGRIPFMLAAFLFILGFMLFFDYRDNPELLKDRRRWALRALIALLIAGVASWAISIVFQDVFFVRLP